MQSLIRIRFHTLGIKYYSKNRQIFRSAHYLALRKVFKIGLDLSILKHTKIVITCSTLNEIIEEIRLAKLINNIRVDDESQLNLKLFLSFQRLKIVII